MPEQRRPLDQTVETYVYPDPDPTKIPLPDDPSRILRPREDLVQLGLSAFVPRKGWLHTKPGHIYGGHHGRPPTIDMSEEELFYILSAQLKAGIRAMKHRWDHRDD